MAKYTGLGGKLFIGTAGATPVYTEIAQVASIGSVAITADEVEVTTLDNTSGFREYLTTFKDAGELPVTLVWDPALPTHGPTAEGLWALMLSQEIRPFKIEFPTKPTSYEATFEASVKSFPTPAMTPDDALTADVSLRVTGTVDLAVAALGGTLSADEQRRAAEEYRRNRGRAGEPVPAGGRTLGD
jgi:Lambda phage tail tube protein, TTP